MSERMNDKPKSPFQQRQTRIEELKRIYEANKDKDPITLANLFRTYLILEGLYNRTVDSYIEYMKAWIATQKRV